MGQETLFEEKQYLGYNKFSLIRRIVIALFCFLIYFYSGEENLVIEPSQRQANFIFYVGSFILMLSGVLLFILHLQTRVVNGSIILEGLWTARKIKIDLQSVKSVERIAYSKYFMNRPVYNLHLKGKVRFFTRGKDAIQLTDKDGLIYIIGTQRAAELERVLKEQLKSLHQES